MVKTLNIVGCGHLGRVLGRLWLESGTFVLQDVLNRSLSSASEAVDFIGGGRALDDFCDLRRADVHLIGTPDAAIPAACAELARTGVLQPRHIVFHCSGALPSKALHAAASHGAAVASLHPIKSFADPAYAARNFAGTWCGVEGDPDALAVLTSAFEAIGGQTVGIDPESKSIYHAAAVFASNYLVTLMDAALEAYQRAGIPHATALKIVEPLVRGTIDNVFAVGTTAALSGPIARGDAATVVRQYRALATWSPRTGQLYKQLGKATAVIARRRQGLKRG
jgi:predicted short-subunit dehydrogenase-like oxidoreductase (DUF2520 family)